MKTTNPFKGWIPALMMPCDSSGKPNWDAYFAHAQRLINSGASAVVANGSMGNWSLLTQEVRRKAVEGLVSRKIPVIVGTGAQCPADAKAIAEHAKEVGAAGLMMIPRQCSRVSVVGSQIDHFSAMLETELPAVIYNSPYYGYQTKAAEFSQLRARYPNLVGFKEFGGAAALDYAAKNIVCGDDELSLVVGVDTQVYFGFVDCGAVGTITGIGNALPEQVDALISLCLAGRKGDLNKLRRAKELDERLMPLAQLDESPELVEYYKYLLVLAGHPEFTDSINPDDRLSQSQAAYVKMHYEQLMAWWAEWKKEVE